MERIRSNVEKLSSTDVSVQENSLRYLINISADGQYQITILDILGTNKLNELLLSENEVIQMLSTWLLSHLCLNNENNIIILKSPDLLVTLNKLLVAENQDIQEKVLWVLSNLTLCSEHSHLLVEHSIIESLASFLTSSNPTLIILACLPLRNLLHKDTCAEYLDNQKELCHSGAIQNINKILTSRYPTPTNELILSLTSIIHVLSIYHPLIRRIIAISGVLYQLVALLSSPSSPVSIKEQVMKILINLSLTEETERPILDSGAMMPLIDIVVSVSSSFTLKSLGVSCLANLTSNQDIRKILKSKYLVDGLAELLRDKSSHTSQLLEAISLLIANLCIDENCRYLILQSDLDQLLSKLVDYPHTQVRESILKAIENMRVPISTSVHNEINSDKEDLSDLDPTDSLGPSLSLSPSPINKGIMRYSRSVSPQTLKFNLPSGSSTGGRVDDANNQNMRSGSQQQLVDDPNLMFRRGKIIKEIVDTEQAYIYSLNVCIRVYFNPLMVNQTYPPILPTELVEYIFSNIDKVFRINCEFLKKLRSLIPPDSKSAEKIDVMDLAQAMQWLWEQPTTIPEYRIYINGFNRAMDLIHENRAKVPKFKEFLEKCQFSDQCKSETLESYLIRPVQRIPRYILLLNDLLIHTVDIFERTKIEEALKKTKMVADQLNESKRRAENHGKALVLQDKVIGLQEGFSLHTRQLLKEGLMMESRQKKVSKYRYLLLFSDQLYITKPKKSKYVIQKTIPLIDIKVIDVPSNNQNLENSFRLYWSNRDDRNENGLVICSSKPEEKEDWTKEIREASNTIKRLQLENKLKSGNGFN